MKDLLNTAILDQLITDLEMSREFKNATEILGFYKLKDLINIKTFEMEQLTGFNILLVHEYVSFLESHRLGELIDP